MDGEQLTDQTPIYENSSDLFPVASSQDGRADAAPEKGSRAGAAAGAGGGAGADGVRKGTKRAAPSDDARGKRVKVFPKPLQEIAGGQTHGVPFEATKHVHRYIKENSLQDTNNRKYVIADARLEALFKRKRFTYFQMSKLLSHALKEWVVVPK